jgi:hypothetical protein
MKKDGITSFVVKKGSSRRYRRFGGNGLLSSSTNHRCLCLERETQRSSIAWAQEAKHTHTFASYSLIRSLLASRFYSARDSVRSLLLPSYCTALARANSLYFVLLALATLEACFTTPAAAAAVARRSCSSVYNFQRATLERETDRELELC